jgi:hypothetical protein
LDTVGESFELNIAAVQEAEMLTRTAKPIILAQGPVQGKWNLGYSNTTQASSNSSACSASICLK